MRGGVKEEVTGGEGRREREGRRREKGKRTKMRGEEREQNFRI